MARQAQEATGVRELTAIADRGYFKGEEILACEAAGVTPLVPKPLTSGAKADGRFGKQDFVYDAGEDFYRCPAGEKLTWRYSNVEAGRKLHNYWTTKCAGCALKSKCTPAKERRVKRWEHEAVLDAMQERLERAPQSMRLRRQTAEHPFGTIKPSPSRLQPEADDRYPRRSANDPGDPGSLKARCIQTQAGSNPFRQPPRSVRNRVFARPRRKADLSLA
jgi:hypothetical protein